MVPVLSANEMTSVNIIKGVSILRLFANMNGKHFLNMSSYLILYYIETNLMLTLFFHCKL